VNQHFKTSIPVGFLHAEAAQSLKDLVRRKPQPGRPSGGSQRLLQRIGRDLCGQGHATALQQIVQSLLVRRGARKQRRPVRQGFVAEAQPVALA
jgi:hypothetical protein